MAAPVSSSSGSRSSLPREALVVQAILKDMGVTEYDPAVVNQLLDFSYSKLTSPALKVERWRIVEHLQESFPSISA